MCRDTVCGEGPDGQFSTRYVHVVRAQPQISAEGRPRSVAPRERSLDAQRYVAAYLSPQYQIVGNFHTHLLKTLQLLERIKGWVPSPRDLESSAAWAEGMSEIGERPPITMILALTRSRRTVERSHYKGMSNALQHSVGEVYGVLATYRILESGRLSAQNIRLRVPGMIE
jgi:hypothetical protein